MKDKITITHDEFVEIIADEISKLLNMAEEKGVDSTTGMLTGMLVTTFGSAISHRLFKDDKEEDEDGADS